MQNQSMGLELTNEPVILDPKLGYTHASEDTHSPSAALTFLHYHDSLEIGYCYEGSGVFIVDGRIMPFSAGCASIIFPNEIHIARSSAEHGSKWRFINLDPALLLGRSFPDTAGLWEAGSGVLHSIILPDGPPPGLNPVIREMIEESKCRDPAGAQAMKGLALCMFARISRLIKDAAPAAKPPAHREIKRISAALDYMIKNHALPMYIDELASACCMSPATFRRVFHRAMGMTPNGYIHALRIQLSALQLRNSVLPVLDIALMVGYDSLSSFNRHFKRIMGVSPREYRRQ